MALSWSSTVPSIGAGYGLVVSAVSYLGWLPLLRIMPPAHRDKQAGR